MYDSQFWGSKFKVRVPAWFWWEPPFRLQVAIFSLYPQVAESREASFLWGSCKGTNPISKSSNLLTSSNPSYLPKSPPPDSYHTGTNGFNIYIRKMYIRETIQFITWMLFGFGLRCILSFATHVLMFHAFACTISIARNTLNLLKR